MLLFIFCLEAIIYLWALWTTEPEFIFDKCARNSGRVSSLINLSILLMMGYYGSKKICADDRKKGSFRILITLFAVNHLIHFIYVFQNFNSHSLELSIAENLHGFVTFIFILMLPFTMWQYNNLNRAFYLVITVHLFNVSYFIMKTFYSKVKPEKPAYHNQLGMVITSIALLYILYSFFREYRQSTQAND